MNRVIVFNVYSNYTVLFHTAVQCSEMSCKIFSAWHSLYPSFWLLVCVWLWSSSNFLVLWNLYTLAHNFPFSFSMTWIVYLEFLLPFHVPWWNIHDCSWLFFQQADNLHQKYYHIFLETGAHGTQELKKLLKNDDDYHYNY